MSLMYLACGSGGVWNTSLDAPGTFIGADTINIGGRPADSADTYQTAKFAIAMPSEAFDYYSIRVVMQSISSIVSGNPRVKYAICVSDANDALYVNTLNDQANNDIQIAAGVAYLSIDNSGFCTFDCSSNGYRLEPDRKYYLYLWGYQSIQVIGVDENNNPVTDYVHSKHTFTSKSLERYGGAAIGFVYIDTGSEIGTYKPCIDDGMHFKHYAPYIDTGISWELQA